VKRLSKLSEVLVVLFVLSMIFSSLSLAAADENIIRINFQDTETPVPEGFFADYGEVFGVRDNGLTYGWSKDLTNMARRRAFVESIVLLDTMNHFRNETTWDIELENGLYNVTVAIGDAWESTHSLSVEDVVYWEDLALDGLDFRVLTKTIELTDGQLTISPMDAKKWGTRICYVIIVPVGAAE